MRSLNIRMAQPSVRAVLRYFPRALLQLEGASWRVNELYGNSEELPELKRAVAAAISTATIKYSYLRGEKPDLEEVEEDLYRRFGIPSARGPKVDAERVVLIEPTKGELVLWPPTFVCVSQGPKGSRRVCKTFYLAEKEEPIMRCEKCHGGAFWQPSLVLVCEECSNCQPLVPPPQIARKTAKGHFICERCRKGLIRLDYDPRKITKSRWRCSNCEAEHPLTSGHYCRCTGKPRMMRVALTSEEPVKPAIVSMLYVGGRELEAAVSSGITPYKRAGDVMDDRTINLLEEVFGVDTSRLYLLHDVMAVICAYGYKTSRDAIVRFFEKYEEGRKKYYAYFSRRKGSAIFFKMKKVDLDGERWFTFLHTVEHALVKASHLLAGAKEGAFMGKVLQNAGAVVIYEAEASERGSLDYIFEYRLAELFTEAHRLLFACKYGCNSACMGCVFVRDPLCHPVDDYFVPNSKLDRWLVLDTWKMIR